MRVHVWLAVDSEEIEGAAQTSELTRPGVTFTFTREQLARHLLAAPASANLQVVIEPQGDDSMELGPLTDAEREVLEAFASAWRLFALLPRRHPDELIEARAHLHALQQTRMARAAVRAYPDLFTSFESFR